MPLHAVRMYTHRVRMYTHGARMCMHKPGQLLQAVILDSASLLILIKHGLITLHTNPHSVTPFIQATSTTGQHMVTIAGQQVPPVQRSGICS